MDARLISTGAEGLSEQLNGWTAGRDTPWVPVGQGLLRPEFRPIVSGELAKGAGGMFRCRSTRCSATIVVLAAIPALLMAGCRAGGRGDGGTPADADALTIGIALQPPSALALIAQEMRFFSEAGVAATVTDYVSGKRALDAMLSGDVDVATSADVPIAIRSFEHPDLRILATIAATDNEPRIIARKDRGIGSPADLRGKRIATQKASAVHFFLHSFLARHGLSEDDIELSFMEAEELPGALVRGTIDAFSMREPFISLAREGLGGRTVVFEAPGLYLRRENLACLAGLTQSKPRAIRRTIEALTKAEGFARDNPRRAMAIVAGRLDVPTSEMSEVYRSLDLRVRLDQSLLMTLEDVAKWATGAGLTDHKRMPNYLSILCLAELEAVAPNAITVVK